MEGLDLELHIVIKMIFRKIKTENIVLHGEKNRFCLEAIYALILAGKSFTNLNFNQPKELLLNE